MSKVTATYKYFDAHGVLLAEQTRLDPKRFLWYQILADGTRRFGFEDGFSQNDLPLYRLREVLATDVGDFVYYVEGCKDADNLSALGVVATTSPEGGKPDLSKIPASRWEPLRDRHVVILPDNDDVGYKYAEAVFEKLRNVAASTRIVTLPNLPTKGDCSDWIAAGGTLEQLQDRAEAYDVMTTPETERERQERERAELAMTRGRLVTVNLANVQPERVTWLWSGRLPFGKLWLLDGPPGQGKSFITMSIAAHVTTGGSVALPDAEPCHPASVVMIALEDGIADTLAPRARSAGVDLSRLHVVRHIERPNGESAIPKLPDDVDLIRDTVIRTGAKLVILDPLMSYLGAETDAYRDADMRRALLPLSQLAEETGAAVLVVRHTKKSAGKAIMAGAGSLGGILGIARGAMVLNADPDDPERRVLAVSKSNLAAFPDSLVMAVENGPGGPRVVWHGTSPHSADSLTEESAESGHSALGEACDWLEEFLENGPKTKREIEKAAKAEGVALRTVERAKQKLHVRHRRISNGEGMSWLLAKHAKSPTVGGVHADVNAEHEEATQTDAF